MTKPPNLSSGTKWAAMGIVTILGILVVIAASEGLTRLRQLSKYGTATSFENLYRFDEKIGIRVLVPNAQIGPITINSLGFRGPEIPIAKPEGRLRIAFLGASTTFCAEVSDESMVWPDLVVESLRARFPGTEFDYVNGGVPGYRVETSHKNLRYKIEKLNPDIVVIYHATNDLSHEVGLEAEAQGLTPSGYYLPSWLSQHLLLWELAEKNIRVKFAQRGAESDHGRVVLDGERLGSKFREDLRELIKASSSDNRRVAVATFSTRLRPEQSVDEMKKSAVSALVYMPFMSLDNLLFGYARYNEIIRQIAGERGALLIGGENEIPGDAIHFVDSVHFTDAGSRKMAERVVEALSQDPKIAALILSRKSTAQ